MKSLSPTEHAALLIVAEDDGFLCEADATVTVDELGPDIDASTIDSLETRGAIVTFACPACSAAASDGVEHSRLTDLGRLALRLANATLSDLITA
jgi:hypothetical protein